MCHIMSHRGPNGDGLTVLPHCVLGHRRLAIVDLSERGKQPMATPDERLWVTFNGEIYNHLALRSQLEGQGHVYRSRTDTESLLYGYQTWGTQLSTHCRGMWALAIWDVESETLYLSRDRMGEKPLYYCLEESRLAFASSLAGLRPTLSRCEISMEAVASLLAYEYIPHTECIYEGIQKLPPAHFLVFNRSGLHVEPYWQLDFRDKLDITVEEAEQQVEAILDSAVKEQLEADVTVGTFLSGGIDSGYITALAARHKPGVIGLTMTVPGSERDESANARQIAATHDISHIQIPLDESCITALPGLLASAEPLGDSSMIPAAATAQAAAQHMTVALTGDGGDEGFGGYGKALIAWNAEQRRQSPWAFLYRALGPAVQYMAQQQMTPALSWIRPYKHSASVVAGVGLDSWLQSQESTPMTTRRALYGPALQAMMQRPPGAFYRQQLQASCYSAWWDAVLSVGMKTRLVGDFLHKVDTSTMYHSLETRAPFLDHRLIELAAQLPTNVWRPDQPSKTLLKRLAARHNPKDVVYGPKKGFSIPVEKYFLQSWGKLLLDLTQDGVSAQLGLLDPAGVRRYLQHHSLHNRLDTQLYSILTLELWLRVFHARMTEAETLSDKLRMGLAI